MGLGFGDAVIAELLSAENLLPDLPVNKTVQVLLVSLSQNVVPKAVKCATLLRKSGISVELGLNESKMKRVLQKANKYHAGIYHDSLLSLRLIFPVWLCIESLVVFSADNCGNEYHFHKCLKSGVQVDFLSEEDALKIVCRYCKNSSS